LGKKIPLWGTWDDHDFGGNDTDGNVKDKETIRKVFREYRAHHQFGENDQGIYTRFRRGPVEVFLLDARYFAQTEPSPVDPNKTTCLGRQQWNWLLKGLQQSDAPFKLIAAVRFGTTKQMVKRMTGTPTPMKGMLCLILLKRKALGG